MAATDRNWQSSCLYFDRAARCDRDNRRAGRATTARGAGSARVCAAIAMRESIATIGCRGQRARRGQEILSPRRGTMVFQLVGIASRDSAICILDAVHGGGERIGRLGLYQPD